MREKTKIKQLISPLNCKQGKIIIILIIKNNKKKLFFDFAWI